MEEKKCICMWCHGFDALRDHIRLHSPLGFRYYLDTRG